MPTSHIILMLTGFVVCSVVAAYLTVFVVKVSDHFLDKDK